MRAVWDVERAETKRVAETGGALLDFGRAGGIRFDRTCAKQSDKDGSMQRHASHCSALLLTTRRRTSALGAGGQLPTSLLARTRLVVLAACCTLSCSGSATSPRSPLD